MKKYVCNPVNISYKYQFIQMFRMKVENGKFVGNIPGKESVTREAADPSMIKFKGKYYLFPSVSKGFWVSENLADWEYVRLHNTPHNDYAPDVRVVGDYIYFCASKRGEICPFYRTKDPMSGIFEVLPGSFDFWDPNLFCDDDGKMYFYWGCTNRDPVFGVELNPDDMTKKGEVHSMIPGKPDLHGFERIGENHILPELGPDASELEKKIRQYCGTAPYIEGAWMTKYKGKYYLQYAAPGTEYNIYADGVYVSDNPLEGFEYANNNPYSYKPGGFITGAGHGSTMCDKYGNWWHVATMRISKGHQFERKLEKAVGHKITTAAEYLSALVERLDFFVSKGCRFTDHGFEKFSEEYIGDTEAEKLFARRDSLTDKECEKFFGWLLVKLTKEYGKRNLAMQLHFAVIRNNNAEMFVRCGVDSGFDLIGETQSVKGLIKYFNQVKDEERPLTIVYTLNDSNLAALASVTGAFRNVRMGAAWWFNDTLAGIRRNLETISEYSVLDTNLGMLTDSRSFSSYCRFDFFRRILADYIGRKVDLCEYDEKSAKTLAENICYNNPKKMIGG